MVLTRKKRRDLGIVTSPLFQECYEKQSKITQYFLHTRDNENGNGNGNEQKMAEMVELKQDEALLFPSAAQDHSTFSRGIQDTENNNQNRNTMSLAHEIVLAEILSSELQEETRNSQKSQTSSMGSQTENNDCYPQDWLLSINLDLAAMKKYLTITNGLLLTLVENYPLQAKGSEFHGVDPPTTPQEPEYTKQPATSKCTQGSAAENHLHQGKDIGLYVSVPKTEFPIEVNQKKRGISKRSHKKKAETKKKSKNIKTARKSVTNRRACKVCWKRLYKLIPTKSKTNSNKPAIHGSRENNSVDPGKKIQLKSLKETSLLPNKTSEETESLPGCSMLKPQGSINIKEDSPHTIDYGRSQDEPVAGQDLPQDKGWKLMLADRKLAFLNYPKPKGFLTQEERSVHFVNTLDDMLPGKIKLNDITSVDFIFYNGYSLRVIASFKDQNLAKYIYRSRHLLLKKRITVTRFFENSTCLKLFPDEFTTAEIRFTCKPKEERGHSKDKLEHTEQGSLKLRQEMRLPNEGTDNFYPEEKALINQFGLLPFLAQSEILRRLETLRNKLTEMNAQEKVREKEPATDQLKKENLSEKAKTDPMKDYSYNTSAIAEINLLTTDLTQCARDKLPSKKETILMATMKDYPYNTSAAAEINLTATDLTQCVRDSNNLPSKKETIPMTTTTRSWTSMRYLDEDELGISQIEHLKVDSPKKGVLITNVSTLHPSTDSIEYLGDNTSMDIAKMNEIQPTDKKIGPKNLSKAN